MPIRRIALVLSLGFFFLARPANGINRQNSNDPAKAWAGTDMANGLIGLKIVPEIGGRVIQYSLGNHGFFWVNPELAGSTPPASGVGPDGSFLNYGGDKLWLAPQGWDNNQQWPGPPDAVLDGQPYSLEIIDRDGKDLPTALRFVSRPDRRSGIQISRIIRIEPDTTRVHIEASMTNIDDKPRRWGIWAHTQLDAGNRRGDGFNPDYSAYCPLNPKSTFPRGYDVMFGLVGEPGYRPNYDAELLQVKYQRRVGKIGLDSPAGWVATVDGTDGYVFVQRFTYEPAKPYPDNSSVEFWMNGLGAFYAWGKLNPMSDDPKKNPFVFESEVLSPFAALKPKETASYRYEWAAASIPRHSPVMACNNVGATCAPISIVQRGETSAVAGSFGVFARANAKLIFQNANGEVLPSDYPLVKVSPAEAFDLSNCPQWQDLKIPVFAAKVSIDLVDFRGRNLGELSQTVLLSRKVEKAD